MWNLVPMFCNLLQLTTYAVLFFWFIYFFPFFDFNFLQMFISNEQNFFANIGFIMGTSNTIY